MFCYRNLGAEKQLIIFDFGHFRIGRQVTVIVEDSRQSMLTSGDPYARHRGYTRYKQSADWARNSSWVVPGVKPLG